MSRGVHEDLDQIVRESKIVVCVGSGGVGKTTTSAVLALHGALAGRKVLVLTIDPAKRLANSLGVAKLDNEEQQIDISTFAAEHGYDSDGELWAMMLDMKRSFDRLVQRYADPDAREKILNNRLYQYFSTSLAGTQEYSAMERLHELYNSGRYDLIVMDTPPTVHALDFLDAPVRMAEAVESSALQWLYKPSLAAGKFGLGLFNIGTSYVLKTIGKLTGAEMMEELKEFLVNFKSMLDGLGSRAREIRAVLGSDVTTFVVVTSPDPATVDEARFFRRRLAQESIPFGGFIVNRVHAPFLESDMEFDRVALASEIAEALGRKKNAATKELASVLLDNAEEFQVLAELDRITVEALHERAGPDVPIHEVPYFSRDIYSFAGLDMVRHHLFALGEQTST